MKKQTTQTPPSGSAATYLDAFSKTALADLVVDLLRLNAGTQDLDGLQLVDAVEKAMGPIAVVRGDKMPRRPRAYTAHPQGGDLHWTTRANIDTSFGQSWFTGRIPGGV